MPRERPMRNVIATCIIENEGLPATEVADAILAELAAAPESARLDLARRLNPWRPIEQAPFNLRVHLGRRGENLFATAYRLGPVGGWRHAHTSEQVCFEPDVWLPLPAPPTSEE